MSESEEYRQASRDLLEEVASPFYRALGQSITRWQYVETGMFLLCHAIMRCNYKYSSAAFYMLNSANMKLTLLNRLAEVHFSADDLKNHWEPTLKDLKNAIKFRNGLAHFEINLVIDARGIKRGDPPVVLTPHHTDIFENEKPLVKAVFLTELNQAAAFYLELANRLFALVQHHFSPEELRATQLPHQLMTMLMPRQKTPPDPQSPPPQPES